MTTDLHRIHYRWTEHSLLGERGMSPAESSLAPEYLEWWNAHLRDHVWATGPEPGWTYLRWGTTGALIRKVTTTGEGARPGSSAQVLIGDRLMTPQVAVGLTTWGGWDGPAAVAVPWGRVGADARRGIRAIRKRARALSPDHLAALLAHLLDASGEPFSVLAEPDPLAVVMAFVDLVGRPSGFATDEADDNGAAMPEAVFLREVPFSTTVAARRRLMAQIEPADHDLHRFAGALARAYRSQGRAGITRIRAAAPPADAEQARAWAWESQFAPGVLADLTRLHLLGTDALDTLAAAPERVAATARSVPAADLAYALGQSLPPPLTDTLIVEALARAVPPTGDHVLLEALAKHGPLAPGLLLPYLRIDLDRLAYVTGLLLSRDDRVGTLIEAMSQLTVPDLISWIGERAADDRDAAWAGYHQMLGRVPGLGPDGIRALVGARLLAAPLRAVFGTAAVAGVAQHVAALLAAFPAGTHDLRTLTPLIDQGDPAVLHAIDSLVADPEVRELLLQRIRYAYYQRERLSPPVPPRPAGGDPPAGSFRLFGGRRRSADDRTAT